jgi:hypothetical protein
MRSDYLTSIAYSVGEFERLQAEQDRMLLALTEALTPSLVGCHRRLAAELGLVAMLTEDNLLESVREEAKIVANHVLSGWCDVCRRLPAASREQRLVDAVTYAIRRSGYADEPEPISETMGTALAGLEPWVLPERLTQKRLKA